MDIEKLQLHPAYRVVSDDLRQRIVRGEIQPGEPLPTESDLASRFGVHRSTIREGLRQLEQDGLVRRQGKKLLVAVPRNSDLASAAERAARTLAADLPEHPDPKTVFVKLRELRNRW